MKTTTKTGARGLTIQPHGTAEHPWGTWTTQQIADAFSLTTRRIRQLVDSGGLPRVRDGVFDAVDVMRWVNGKLQEAESGGRCFHCKRCDDCRNCDNRL